MAQTRLEQSGANSSSTRRPFQDGTINCYYGLPAIISKSDTKKNPGGLFFGCPSFKTMGKCNFFKWVDDAECTAKSSEPGIGITYGGPENRLAIADLGSAISKLQDEFESCREVHNLLRCHRKVVYSLVVLLAVAVCVNLGLAINMTLQWCGPKM